MKVKLPHTGMEVPHDRLRIEAYEEMLGHDGVAFRAQLYDAGRHLGVIENGGFGGPTSFWQNTSGDRSAMVRFVEACRVDGEPLSAEEWVWDNLVDEYQTAVAVADLKPGESLVRGLSEDRTWDGALCALAVPATLLARTDSPLSNAVVRTLREVSADTRSWEWWSGSSWMGLSLPGLSV
ncbi:hypothetical protein AB0J01_28210 [Streptomyces sp. NPDC050204]|uniref:hypothetical protein n=1 Tax=Streptomyces sp. NPDC050204 TaxID=3155514 RepID=UPI003437FBC0